MALQPHQSDIRPGIPLPPAYGARVIDDTGVQFTMVSRNATAVSVLLFDNPSDSTPSREIAMDPDAHRLGDVWSIFVRGLSAEQLYLFRVDGPWNPGKGLWFNPHRPVLDPWARGITGCFDQSLANPRAYTGADPLSGSMATDSHLAAMPKCVVIADEYDWRGDQPLRIPAENTVIYEMHVRGLTRHQSSDVSAPGTYRGVVEKIPHLKDLGVTAVELLPVQQFETHSEFRNPDTGQRLSNYWGYDPLLFDAPHAGYSHDPAPGSAVFEFREMVRQLHANGIEVILDVVFNHTAEGNHRGAQLSFRGVDNPVWYLLEPKDKSRYLNLSGTGNTVNCDHPVVRQMIVESLRYWVQHMHVDGFRFDLAPILGRGVDGSILPDPPLLKWIANDPVLRSTKIIAEAWDAAGAYMIGGFPERWCEWNGRFRDDVRRFWLHGDVPVGALATRLAGSADLYQTNGRTPLESVNFITCHDGFTLLDLVSYNRKHNRANGEDNRDGANDNHSNNHGVEGPTDDPQVREIRLRQARNLMATLLLSQGMPMLLSGDEFLRTQGGNNNAYCQDNEISWVDWGLAHENRAFTRFVKELIRFRQQHALFRRRNFFQGTDADGNDVPDVEWFDHDGLPQEWAADSRTLMARMDGSRSETGAHQDDADALILVNGSDEEVTFQLAATPTDGDHWRVFIDTARASTHGINPAETGRIVIARDTYRLVPKSLACLLSSRG